MAAKVLVVRERLTGEKRVALVPSLVSRFRENGYEVLVEKDAGVAAGFLDSEYAEAGATLTDRPDWATIQLVLTVRGLGGPAIEELSQNAIVVGLLSPTGSEFPCEAYRRSGVRAFALENIPRITRAQSMDALSSQAAASGYRAALVAANALPRFFPMLTTAAGTLRPAKVFVIGAGVAGLQAIATAHRLGALVTGYDVRSTVREQVESLGGKFLQTEVQAEGSGGYARELTDQEKDQQAASLAKQIAQSNVLITTASVPGRPAPTIVTADMVAAMPTGSVVVDLAAPSGGNCELTEPGKLVTYGPVRIYGPLNAASDLATHASEMYARNVYNFVQPWTVKEDEIEIPLEDEVYQSSLVTSVGGDTSEASYNNEETNQ